MKKTGKKRVLNIILITILLILGLFCVGLMYLFFIPDSTLFNITFVSRNNIAKSATFNYKMVETVKLETNRFATKICESPDENVYVEVTDKSLGYTLVKNKDLKIEHEYINNIVTFTVTEPTGVLFSASSEIRLYIPNEKTINVEIENKKSDTSLKDGNVQLGSFSYTTKSGDIVLEKGRILNKSTFNLDKASCEFKDKFYLKDADVEILLNSGKFNAKNVNLNNVKISKNVNGVILLNNCNTLTQDLETSNGRIEVNKLNLATITAGKTKITINEVTENINATFKNSGSISIGTLQNSERSTTSSISTLDGNISISNCKFSVLLESTGGNISVLNAYEFCQAKTVSGNISISYAEKALSASNGISRTAYIKTVSGNVYITGVDYISLLEITNGYANINYNNICGKNFIKANEGKVDICLNMNSKYDFTAKTNSGKIKVNFTQTEKYNGWTETQFKNIENHISINNNEDHNNLLNVESSSGNIFVTDTNLK